MKYFLLLLFVFYNLSSFGQYTEVINANHPGFSVSPYTIGTGVYQVESGLFYQHNDHPDFFTKRKSMGTDVSLRTGLFLEKLELNANFKIQKDAVLNNIVTGTTMPKAGISAFSFGAKYMIFMPKYKDKSKEIRSWKKKYAYDWSRLIPGVGVYAGLHTNWLSPDYKMSGMSPKASILLQQDFDDWTTLVTNIYANYLTLEEQRAYGYVTTLTYSITDRLSLFGEYKGEYTRYTKEFQAGGGFAYLASKNLQIGLHTYTDLQFDYLNIYGALGVSWRLDRHKDKEIRVKGDGSGEKVLYKKDNFFKRLFGKGRRSKAPKSIKGKKRRQKREKKSKKPRKRRERRTRR